MKKLFAGLLSLVCSAAIAQSYPSPTYNNLTVLGAFTSTGNIGLGSLAAQAANTVVANATASSASPTAFVMPSCSAANTALQWTSSSGFGCNTGIVPASGGNYTGALGISASSAHMNINDTSGSGSAYIVFLDNSATAWRLLSNSSTGVFSLDRYVAGSFADSPLQFSNSSGLLTMPDALTVNGALAANNSLSVGATRTSSSGIEIGGTAGTAASAYTDFHSSGNNIDYDSRIISSGGTTTAGQGSLQYIANGGHTFTGQVNASSVHFTGGTIDGTSVGATTPGTGAFTTLSASGAITPSQTAGIVGTTTNNNANAGSWGEYQSATTTGTSVPSANTAVNATSVSLTAGDWDVTATVNFNATGGSGISNLQAGVGTTSATMPTALGTRVIDLNPHTGSAGGIYQTPIVRISLSSTTTVYALAQIGFSAGTFTVDGFIRARRVR